MAKGYVLRLLFNLMVIAAGSSLFAQNSVPLGIHYQAVARDNYGNELVNKKISVKFSIISGDPLGSPVYQEVHQDVITSRFGVFTLIIGKGVTTGSAPCTSLSQIAWDMADHYLKVEVKFENDFMDMGTMKFMAVPYALYAQRSLEPGPAGPQGSKGDKGDPGDPATDDQTLSVENVDGSDYLAISDGNKVKISSIEKDGDPANEIQDLVISSDKLKITRNSQATEWDLTRYLDNTDSQTLTWDAANRVLGISGNPATINLTELENDADANPSNEIQDLQLSSDKLSITGKTGANEINLGVYRDNTDAQTLTFSESTNILSISGGNNVSLGSMVAFRAKKTASETVSTWMSDYDFITGPPIYNDGGGYDYLSGEFTAPAAGLYTFDVSYTASGSGGERVLKIFLNGSLYEVLNNGIASNSSITRSVTMKLASGNKVKVMINVGTGFDTGIGSFSGFKVY